MSSAIDLQQAIFDALNGPAIYPVYDDVPQFDTMNDSDFPYIVIGDDTLEQWDDDKKNGFDATITIHAFSRARGRRELKLIQSVIYNILHRKNLAIGSYGTTGFSQEFMDSQLEADGLTRHGVQRFRTFFAEPHDFYLGNC